MAAVLVWLEKYSEIHKRVVSLLTSNFNRVLIRFTAKVIPIVVLILLFNVRRLRKINYHNLVQAHTCLALRTSGKICFLITDSM